MIALVTGGSHGIGAATVKLFKKHRMKVAVVSRTPVDCDLFIQADLTKLHDRFRIVDRVVDGLGGLDVLVNNAGAQSQQKAVNYEGTQFKRDLELMTVAPFDLSQQAAKYMLMHNGGSIVNVLSTGALQGARNIVGYITAKHALLGLTRAMAVEFAPKIRVNAVAPGLTETDMTEKMPQERKDFLNSITPAGRFGNASEMAEAIYYLTQSKFVYGQTLVVDGGWMVKNG
jgi:NAD(P)-dependent dehydrogenase (short-subunit alcohol dehydrogenase family)